MSDRQAFFDAVYAEAGTEPGAVPWADLSVKSQISDWLKDHSGRGRRAVDVACGLGDNAEAMAAAGWSVTAFDYAARAIHWAKERFPDTGVDYQVADLFNLPSDWIGGFDLVNECYTLQALPPETLTKTVPAIASLVAPGGRLLVYSRTRPSGMSVEGPPWPLEEHRLDDFVGQGLSLVTRTRFELEKDVRKIPHIFDVWQKEI